MNEQLKELGFEIEGKNWENKGIVLSPLKYSGSIHGDWGYEIDGVKSEKGYVSKSSARSALDKKLNKIK